MLRGAEQGRGGSSFLPGSRPAYSKNPGKGSENDLEPALESKGPAREHVPLLSLKRGLGQQRLDPESHQQVKVAVIF